MILYLFNPDDFLARRTAEEGVFTSDLGVYLPVFYKAYSDAFDRMVKERSRLRPNEMTSRWPSENVNGFLHSMLVQNDKTKEFIRKYNNTFCFEKEHYKIMFKKVDSKYKPHYNTTTRSYLLEQNLSRTKEDLSSVIYIGYRVDPSWSKLLGVYAISRSRNSLNWIIDLEKYTLENSASFDDSVKEGTEVGNEIPKPEVEIKLKHRTKIKKA